MFLVGGSAFDGRLSLSGAGTLVLDLQRIKFVGTNSEPNQPIRWSFSEIREAPSDWFLLSYDCRVLYVHESSINRITGKVSCAIHGCFVHSEKRERRSKRSERSQERLIFLILIAA